MHSNILTSRSSRSWTIDNNHQPWFHNDAFLANSVIAMSSDVTIVRNDAEFKHAQAAKAKRIRVENPKIAANLKLVMRIPAATFLTASAAAGVAIFSLLTAHTEVVTAPATGGASAVIRFGAGFSSGVIVVSLLGHATAIALLSLGVALGGISGIKLLRREYIIESSGADWVLLKRR